MRALRRKRAGARKAAADRRTAYRETASRVGGVLEEGKRPSADVIRVPYGPWTLELGTYTVHTGSAAVTYTRVRAWFGGHRELRVVVRRRNVFDRIASFLGFASPLPVSPALRERYVVRGRPGARVPSFLSAELVDAILALSSQRLEAKPAARKVRRSRGPDTGVVVCQATGVIRDPERLAGMVRVVQAALDALYRIGESTGAPSRGGSPDAPPAQEKG